MSVDDTVRVAGVDRYPKGWVSIVLRAGRFDTALVAQRLKSLVGQLSDVVVIGLDIPIGLPERGPREADRLARAFVGPRRASVFLTPPRAVLEAPDITVARARSRTLSGGSISTQAWALHETILEADPIAQHDPRVREVHPEVSFAALAGRPLAEPKSSWAGVVHRRQLLMTAGIIIPDELGPAGVAGVADILDAAVAAWSACRVAAGVEESLPHEPQVGADGRGAAIWY